MFTDEPSARLASDLASALCVALGDQGPARVRVFPALVAGDVAWSTVERVHAGRWRPVAAVLDLRVQLSLALLGGRAGRTALLGHAAVSVPPPPVVEELAAWLRGGGLEGAPVTALDAACDGLPLLARAHALPGSWWRAGLWGEWTTEGPSGATLELAGDEEWKALVTVTHEEEGLTLAVGGGELAPPVRVRARDVEELARALEAVLRLVGQALALRRAYRARPFPLRRAADLLLAGLRAAGVADRAWRVAVREHFPSAHAEGAVERHDAQGAHAEVYLEEREAGVGCQVGALQLTLADEAALHAAMPALVAATAEAARALAPDKLEPGALYRVLAPLGGAPTGAELRFERREYFYRDDTSVYRFRERTEGGAVELDERDPGLAAALRALHLFLRRCD